MATVLYWCEWSTNPYAPRNNDTMKLAEVVPLFGLFGFNEDRVQVALKSGDKGFEALQLRLKLHWNRMNQERSAAELNQLRPIYERLQGLKLTSTKTVVDAARERAGYLSIIEQLEALGLGRSEIAWESLLKREAEAQTSPEPAAPEPPPKAAKPPGKLRRFWKCLTGKG